jgi:Sulfotransferase domain
MIMPNFLIIGAAKSGTTSLYHYLKQHPQIYMSSIKETEFFAFEGEQLNFCGPGDMQRSSITNLEDYQKQFQRVLNETAIGEASPVYLYSPKAPERILHYIPDVKLIAILRNPVERAYSQFLMFIRDGREPVLDFAKALQQEKTRKLNNWEWGWCYLDIGFYYLQLKRYFDLFEHNQIKVYLYEDLEASPARLLKDIFQFLNVDENFLPDKSIRYNATGIPKNKFWHQLLFKPSFIKAPFKLLLPLELRKRIRLDLSNRNLVKPHLSSSLRKQLLQVYRDDILKLQDLIQRDLSKWLEESET